MSQETIGAVRGVRIPPVPETRRHRTLDERLFVRFPALARWLSAAWTRLPRDSRLRRAIFVRSLRQVYAAVNRRDFDLLLVALDPGIELHRVEVFLDVSGTFHGHDGYMEVWRRGLESFEDMRLDPEELLDLGDRWLVTVRYSGHGTGSGVAFSQQLFSLITTRRGLVVRQDDFRDRAEALEAVGVSEQDAHADS
jgi:ketosteroid isomerase-like protein